MARKRLKRKLSKKEEKALTKKQVLSEQVERQLPKEVEEKPKTKSIIEIGESVVVRDLASSLSVPVTELIKILMKNGVLATINENIDWETAAIAGDELGFEIKLKEEPVISLKYASQPLSRKLEKISERPPVVTVMGHVDHGKTKLLDTIRQTDVISTEAGGITQHIGAYQVRFKGKKITFIDTPGHEAFETMRAHGANITDIVVLVVAADEGLKPQTIEAFEHAKKAGVPIIVAITKIDLPNANVQKVKKQLSDIGLVSEDAGGKTICVPISAKQNLHIDELLEMILLVSEMREFKASPEKLASAMVVESHLDQKLGPVASVLIQDGSLKEGDFVIVGKTWGKIRLIEDEHKKRLKKAGPSQPVRLAGLKELPGFGEILQAVPDEKTAQLVLSELKKAKTVKGKIISSSIQKELPIVLKADVGGSLGAIKDNLRKIEIKDVAINIVREGVGNITEDDVMMAQSTKAKIFGFKIKIFTSAKSLAEEQKVEILIFDVIYDLIGKIQENLSILAKKEEDVKIGQAKVLKIFRVAEKDKIVGVRVSEGKIGPGAKLKIKRGEEEIGVGKVLSLQVEKEQVGKLEKGSLGGLKIVTDGDLQEGDILEFYKKEFV